MSTIITHKFMPTNRVIAHHNIERIENIIQDKHTDELIHGATIIHKAPGTITRVTTHDTTTILEIITRHNDNHHTITVTVNDNNDTQTVTKEIHN